MSMNIAEQITAILQSELKCSLELSQVLKQERDALKASDHQTLNLLSDRKKSLVLKLEQLGRQRESILKSIGFPEGKAGIEAFVANQSQDVATQLTELIKKLRIVARDCRNKNMINGGVINVHRQHLLKAMAILRGRDPETSAYGPGGEYTSQVVRQPLIGRV